MSTPTPHRPDDSSSEPTAPSSLVAAFRQAVADRREAQARCARLLARIGDERLWETFGCVNVGEFGERHGLASIEARALFDLGRAPASTPTARSSSASAPSRSRPPPASPKS